MNASLCLICRASGPRAALRSTGKRQAECRLKIGIMFADQIDGVFESRRHQSASIGPVGVLNRNHAAKSSGFHCSGGMRGRLSLHTPQPLTPCGGGICTVLPCGLTPSRVEKSNSRCNCGSYDPLGDRPVSPGKMLVI